MPSTTTATVRLFWVYVLESKKDGKRYIGYTADMRKRIEAHQSGKSFATAPRRPFILVYLEGCRDERDAKRREGYLKTTGGRRFLAKRLREYYQSQL